MVINDEVCPTCGTEPGEKRASKKSNEWMQQLWRPMMGWMYMLICFADMIIFPVLWALWQGINHVPITQWNPLTLQGAGLFHIAMGAVLGIAAFGRTQEKLAGTAANPTATSQTITQNTNMSGAVPANYGSGPTIQNNFGSGMGGGYGAPAMGSGFNSPAPMQPTMAPAPAPVQMINGKKAPVQPDFPEI